MSIGTSVPLRALLLVHVSCSVVGCAPWPPPPATPDPWQQANAVVHHAQALREAADAAVKLDGDPQTVAVRDAVRQCTGDKPSCVAASKTAEEKSRVGALAGLADYLTQPLVADISASKLGPVPTPDIPLVVGAAADVALAETAANDAMAEAQKVVAARADGKKAHVRDAMVDCEPDPTACKKKCDGGDDAHCMAWGWHLWRKVTPAKTGEAKVALDRACAANVSGACDLSAQLSSELRSATAGVDQLWAAVQDAADDIAGKSHAAEWALRVSATRQTQVAMARLRKVTAATVVEKYCPAKSEFVAATSTAEFTRRAASHCKADPPSGNEGQSGGQTPLTAECRAAFAATCPAPGPRRQPPVEDAVNTSAAWRAVQEAGDGLAIGRHTLRITLEVNPTPRNMQEAEKVRRYEPTLIAQTYCPAKKAFIAQFSAAEFAKRAAAHCTGDPPMTEGLSGAQVPLPADCRDVFALSCP